MLQLVYISDHLAQPQYSQPVYKTEDNTTIWGLNSSSVDLKISEEARFYMH